jgi:hypothetical protein
MTTRTFHSHALHRRTQAPKPKLKPAYQSYLHTSRQAAVVGFIFAIAALLLATNLWLIRLLG